MKKIINNFVMAGVLLMLHPVAHSSTLLYNKADFTPRSYSEQMARSASASSGTSVFIGTVGKINNTPRSECRDEPGTGIREGNTGCTVQNYSIGSFTVIPKEVIKGDVKAGRYIVGAKVITVGKNKCGPVPITLDLTESKIRETEKQFIKGHRSHKVQSDTDDRLSKLSMAMSCAPELVGKKSALIISYTADIRGVIYRYTVIPIIEGEDYLFFTNRPRTTSGDDSITDLGVALDIYRIGSDEVASSVAEFRRHPDRGSQEAMVKSLTGGRY